MEPDDAFTPEAVDEQIDLLLTSPYTDASSLDERTVHVLQTYYDEGRQATERVWQQLARAIAEQEGLSDDARAGSTVLQERSRPMKQNISLSHSTKPSLFALIAAVLIASLAVSSLLWLSHLTQLAQNRPAPPVSTAVLQTAQATSTAQLAAKIPGVYFIKSDGIEKRDVQTGKVLWHVTHQIHNRVNTPALVIEDAIYLLDDYEWNKIVALNTGDGRMLWSRTYDTIRTTASIRPVLIDGLLYFSGSRVDTVSRETLGGQDVVYAINPADGAIKAAYPAPKSGWHDLVILDRTLYYTVDHPGGTDVYAAQLPGGKVLWHKPGSAPQASTVSEQGTRDAAQAGTRHYEAHGGTVYAFDNQSGKQLWTRPYDTFDLKATPDTLYLSYTIHGTSHRGLAALNAKDGTTLWQSDIPQMSFFSGTFGLHLVNGILYDVAINGDNITVSDPFLYAVQASNGAILWKIPLKNQDDIDSIVDIIG